MTNDVAVFLDLDNLVISAKELGLPFDIQVILRHLEELSGGRIAMRRAYGDWRQSKRMPEELAAVGFELQAVVRLNNWSKNLADMQMVVEAMETLVDGHKFSTYALLTGDRDFTPLVQALRKRGKRVIGLGFRQTASRSLVHLCDDYVFCEQILKPPANGVQKKKDSGKKGRRKKSNGKKGNGEKGEQPVVEKTVRANGETPLAVHYSRALRKQGLRVVPAGDRMLILKELVKTLEGGQEVEWGHIVRDIYAQHRHQETNRQSKNAINSVLIVAKRSGVINVGRGDTLSAAPVTLSLASQKPFQEAVLHCDAQYLKGIVALDLPFDLEQAAVALYEAPSYARYLKIVYGRYVEDEERSNGAAAGTPLGAQDQSQQPAGAA